MTGSARVPQLWLGGGEDHPDRTARLLRAYDAMGALVRIVWPTGSARVNWEGAIVSMHESDGHLTVTWRDEDDYEQFDKIADLGWIAVGEEGTTVNHENADPGGARVLRHGFVY